MSEKGSVSGGVEYREDASDARRGWYAVVKFSNGSGWAAGPFATEAEADAKLAESLPIFLRLPGAKLETIQ